MLADKDRIFTNIYGFEDSSLAGARARGTWDRTKELVDKGHDWIVDEVNRGAALPGLYPMNAETKARYEALLKK
jgi:NADH:ubiquinone oxidoreductase subunit F (NADH-binding)